MIDRFEKINELREKKYSYTQIGKIIGLSKQRVHAIHKGYKCKPELLIQTVRKRDGYQCNLCTSMENIEIHHIDRDQNNNDLNNLILLCLNCHKQTHAQIRKQNNEKLNRLSQDTVLANFRFPRKTFLKLKNLSINHNKTMTEILIRVMDKYL